MLRPLTDKEAMKLILNQYRPSPAIKAASLLYARGWRVQNVLSLTKLPDQIRTEVANTIATIERQNEI